MALGMSSAHLDQDHQQEDIVDDDWYEEGSDAEELERELKAKENEFHKMGYRDGVIAGKEAAAQEGFNSGYKQAVVRGHRWGMVRGVTSALVGLPAPLKSKLAATRESTDELGNFFESLQSISSDDALKMFLEDLSSNRLKRPHNQPEECCPSEVLVDESAAGCGQLENFLMKLESLTVELPDVKLHLERNNSVISNEAVADENETLSI